MSKSLSIIQKDVDKFCKERNWDHPDPNQLIVSMMVELGELSEHYQWGKEFNELTTEEKKEIGYEFVDVLFYLCRLASNTGINIEEMFYEKLPKLAKKYKDGKNVKAINKKYRESGMNKLY